jgi:hypothetical protein
MSKFFGTLLDGFFLMRPVVLIPVWGFALFGYCQGYHGSIAELPLVWRAIDTASIVWIMIFSLSVGCVYVLNQIADIDVDNKNCGLPLLANGIVSHRRTGGVHGNWRSPLGKPSGRRPVLNRKHRYRHAVQLQAFPSFRQTFF